jgi:hypothetical protein
MCSSLSPQEVRFGERCPIRQYSKRQDGSRPRGPQFGIQSGPTSKFRLCSAGGAIGRCGLTEHEIESAMLKQATSRADFELHQSRIPFRNTWRRIDRDFERRRVFLGTQYASGIFRRIRNSQLRRQQYYQTFDFDFNHGSDNHLVVGDSHPKLKSRPTTVSDSDTSGIKLRQH